MLNNVVLIGRTTKDLEIKYTQSGVAVASFTLAVNRNFKGKDGSYEADFINCVAWRKTAELMADFVQKGSLIAVTGSIQTRNYDNQQGQRVYVTEIVVDKFNSLESKKDRQQIYQSNDNQSSQSNIRQIDNNNDPFINDGLSIDINDDSLPF